MVIFFHISVIVTISSWRWVMESGMGFFVLALWYSEAVHCSIYDPRILFPASFVISRIIIKGSSVRYINQVVGGKSRLIKCHAQSMWQMIHCISPTSTLYSLRVIPPSGTPFYTPQKSLIYYTPCLTPKLIFPHLLPESPCHHTPPLPHTSPWPDSFKSIFLKLIPLNPTFYPSEEGVSYIERQLYTTCHNRTSALHRSDIGQPYGMRYKIHFYGF